MFHFTIETEKSVQEAVESIQNTFKKEGFGVLWKLDLQEKLKEKGIELENQFLVLEVCNPHEAKKVMSKNQLAGYFLPCKVVVFKEAGKTKIGMPKPTSLIGLLDDNELTDYAKDIEERLMNCIEEAK